MSDEPGFTKPVPFRVEVPEKDLADLKQRLGHTRWAHDFGNQDWLYGVQREWLGDLIAYWRDKYDWRAQERAINRFPHFKVEIDGVPIHYLHVRGKGPNPMPIILSHGWPWTFWDWHKIIDPLTDPAAHGGDPANSFDVVIPSLPGFGFSTPLTTPGLTARDIARLWNTLMNQVLGYPKYAAGGGDWGSTITGEIGHGHGDRVIGVWLTLPNVPGVNLRQLTREDYAEDPWMWDQMEAAKPTIQSHWTVHRIEPQTLAYALNDSPTGLASWILGRRRAWGDHEGDVFALFDRDFLCTTASIYWFSQSIGSSMRIYADHYRTGAPPPPLHDRKRAIDVPTAFTVFRKELLLMPRNLAAEVTNLQRWTVLSRGGHYPPSEQPDTVVRELRTFFGSL